MRGSILLISLAVAIVCHEMMDTWQSDSEIPHIMCGILLSAICYILLSAICDILLSAICAILLSAICDM